MLNYVSYNYHMSSEIAYELFSCSVLGLVLSFKQDLGLMCWVPVWAGLAA